MNQRTIKVPLKSGLIKPPKMFILRVEISKNSHNAPHKKIIISNPTNLNNNEPCFGETIHYSIVHLFCELNLKSYSIYKTIDYSLSIPNVLYSLGFLTTNLLEISCTRWKHICSTKIRNIR